MCIFIYPTNTYQLPPTSQAQGGAVARDTKAEHKQSPSLKELAVTGEEMAPQLV